MSTRSQLRFVRRIDYENDDGELETVVRTAQIYRHSDGYPEAVIPALLELKALQDATGTERGPAYVAANFVFLQKLHGLAYHLQSRRSARASITLPELEAAIVDGDYGGLARLGQPHFLLGYGVEDPADGIHGDEEYLYVVELPRRGHAHDGTGEWSVKVSGHAAFPRWDGPTREAFEHAQWQFEGTLDDANTAFSIVPSA